MSYFVGVIAFTERTLKFPLLLTESLSPALLLSLHFSEVTTLLTPFLPESSATNSSLLSGIFLCLKQFSLFSAFKPCDHSRLLASETHFLKDFCMTTTSTCLPLAPYVSVNLTYAVFLQLGCFCLLLLNEVNSWPLCHSEYTVGPHFLEILSSPLA